MSPYPIGAGGGGAEETGITSYTSLSDIAASSWQTGWEFKVGAAAITVHKVRMLYGTALSGPGPHVKFWRVSDQVNIANSPAADVTANVWKEVTLTTPLTLAANTNYIIAGYRDGFTMGNHKQNTSVSTDVVFASAISYVQRRHVSGSGFPSSTGANAIWGLPDLIFTK